jgi:hypothetical protein
LSRSAVPRAKGNAPEARDRLIRNAAPGVLKQHLETPKHRNISANDNK